MNEEAILNKAKQILENLEENPLKNINLFTILGMETKEVTAHSAFLYSIFQPFYYRDGESKERRIDNKNLSHLYNFLNGKKRLGTDNPSNLNIYREVSSEFGRLDFLITFGKEDGKDDAAVIELKVYAGEQNDQINRYREYMKSRGYTEDNIFFLTPDNHGSKTGESTAISLKELADEVLIKIADERNIDGYTAIIKQYKTIIEKICNCNGGTDVMSNKELINNWDDIRAVDSLYNARRNALNDMIKDFMGKLEKSFSSFCHESIMDGVRLDLCEPGDASGYYDSGKRILPTIIYEVSGELADVINKKYKCHEQGKESTNKLYFYIEIDHRLYCGFTVRGDKYESVTNYKEKRNASENKAVILYDGAYTSWEYIKYDSKSIDFYDYSGQQDGALRLVDPNSTSGLSFTTETIKTIADSIKTSFINQYKILAKEDPDNL